MMEAYSTSRCAMAVMRAHLVAGETRDAARYYRLTNLNRAPLDEFGDSRVHRYGS